MMETRVSNRLSAFVILAGEIGHLTVCVGGLFLQPGSRGAVPGYYEDHF